MDLRPVAVRLFYSYSSRDEQLRVELEKHLSLLVRSGVLAPWSFRCIEAGSSWQREISKELDASDIILLLISSDFLASNYCWDIEMQFALAKEQSGSAVVVPVILRDCDWQSSELGRLQALPQDGRPVVHWRPRDKAWTDVARRLRTRIDTFQQHRQLESLHAEDTKSLPRVVERSIRVFLSYAHEDAHAAARLYRELSEHSGIDVWFDKKSLLAGERWENAIRNAIENCDYLILLLSTRAVNKRGFFQKEMRVALDLLDTRPSERVFVIPIRLDDCSVSDTRVANLQYVDMFPNWQAGLDLITRALNLKQNRPIVSGGAAISAHVHQAQFRSTPDKTFYFINFLNLGAVPVKLTKVWYDDGEYRIPVVLHSRPLPKVLQIGEVWSVWFPLDRLPAERRERAYECFGATLANGNIIESQQSTGVAAIGPVAGGPIDPRDL